MKAMKIRMHELLAEIHSLGFAVNNLFETLDGWQCNLRSSHLATAWGRGSTYLDALSEALDKAYSGEVVELRTQTNTAFITVKPSLSSIISAVAPKIKRRNL